jgi:predicted DNA-binding antitoxin AbrB/MazE fold protein
MPTIRARFDGKVFIPEQPVELPVGQIVEIQLSGSSAQSKGSAAALLEAMKNLPKIPDEDVAEMERLIEEGNSREAR